MIELGYIHLHATLLASGLADTRIPTCAQAAAEKRTVQRLLHARYDIAALPEESRVVVDELINKGIREWWRTSRYNTSLLSLADEVVGTLSAECQAEASNAGAVVIQRATHSAVRIPADADMLINIHKKMNDRYPGLIFYWRSCHTTSNQERSCHTTSNQERNGQTVSSPRVNSEPRVSCSPCVGLQSVLPHQ
jgi:hypothetical protein